MSDYDHNHNNPDSCDSGDCGSCGSADSCKSARAEQELKDLRLKTRLDKIKNKVLVMSGKGGVGKSMVALKLATLLAAQGKNVGLLDIDIHGPSVPTLLGLEGKPLGIDPRTESMLPIEYMGLKVLSIGFLLRNRDDAIIWRGPLKIGVIRQFIQDVEWGELDYLVIDAPPGTGDEPLTLAQLVPGAHTLVVTTPQKVATADVRKSINFCRKVDLDILGVVENMSGLTCPDCKKLIEIYPGGQAAEMCEEMKVPLLARLPINPELAQASDDGVVYKYIFDHQNPGDPFNAVLDVVLALDDEK